MERLPCRILRSPLVAAFGALLAISAAVSTAIVGTLKNEHLAKKAHELGVSRSLLEMTEAGRKVLAIKSLKKSILGDWRIIGHVRSRTKNPASPALSSTLHPKDLGYQLPFDWTDDEARALLESAFAELDLPPPEYLKQLKKWHGEVFQSEFRENPELVMALEEQARSGKPFPDDLIDALPTHRNFEPTQVVREVKKEALAAAALNPR